MNEVLAFITGLIALVIPGFGTVPEPHYAGYVEADYVYAAPLAAGVIESVAVVEGQAVAAGDVLFVLSSTQQQAALDGAEARVAAADATLRNLETGSREQEVAVVRASLAKAEADLKLAEVTLERTERLAASALTPAAKVDQDRATLASAEAQVANLKAQLAVAELPARNEQQVAAEANLAAARADADKALADLDDRTIVAAQAGVIERLFYQKGEVVGVGTPVLSILPAGELKARFFLPEAERPGFAMGEVVGISCNGCAEGLTAHISFFASDPQFTPPVIYSRDESSRLVFMAEARIDQQVGLLPGQPILVTPKADEPRP